MKLPEIRDESLSWSKSHHFSHLKSWSVLVRQTVSVGGSAGRKHNYIQGFGPLNPNRTEYEHSCRLWETKAVKCSLCGCFSTHSVRLRLLTVLREAEVMASRVREALSVGRRQHPTLSHCAALWLGCSENPEGCDHMNSVNASVLMWTDYWDPCRLTSCDEGSDSAAFWCPPYPPSTDKLQFPESTCSSWFQSSASRNSFLTALMSKHDSRQSEQADTRAGEDTLSPWKSSPEETSLTDTLLTETRSPTDCQLLPPQ